MVFDSIADGMVFMILIWYGIWFGLTRFGINYHPNHSLKPNNQYQKKINKLYV